MQVNSRADVFRMIWNGYLCQIAAGFLALWMLIVTYFLIRRRNTKSSVVDENSAEESDVYSSSENAYNESSSESLNLKDEKKLDLLKFVDTDLENKINCDLVHSGSTSIKKKMMDINNVTTGSGYSSIEDEMKDCNDYTTSQDVSDTCKLNSDSHSSITSWESCNKEIIHSELDGVNSLPLENHTEVCQPLNLCIRDSISDAVNSLSLKNHTEVCQPLNLCIKDQKNETGTNNITKTYFMNRKSKSIKGIQKFNSEKRLIAETIEDYDQSILKVWRNKLMNEFDTLKHTEIGLLNFEKMKNLDSFDNKEYSVNNDKLKYNLETTKRSSIHHDEYSLDDTKNELKVENKSDFMELTSVNHDEYCLDETDHELKTENNLEIKNISPIPHDEYCLDDTEHELKAENNLEIKNISPIPHDEYCLDDTEHELKAENNLEIKNISPIHHDENNLNYTEISLIPYVGNCLKDTEHISNSDEVMLAHNLETTEISPIHLAEKCCEFKFKSPEHSILNNNISISGIPSPNITCNYNYEVQDSHEFNVTSSSESTESLPSPIFNNDSSIDDIRYVEDYNDISFFDPMLADNGMNEAFLED